MAQQNLLSSAIEQQKVEQKEAAGWLAGVVWIISGIYLFATVPDVSFISWKSFLFFIPGTFIASFVWGLLFYFTQRSLAWVLVKVVGFSGPKTATFIGLIGIGLMTFEIIIVYLSARDFIEAPMR